MRNVTFACSHVPLPERCIWLTRNLTVDSFLLAFRTFTSRRGLPATLVTDNAKTFRGASRERVKILRSKEVLECDM